MAISSESNFPDNSGTENEARVRNTIQEEEAMEEIAEDHPRRIALSTSGSVTWSQARFADSPLSTPAKEVVNVYYLVSSFSSILFNFTENQ